MTDTFSPQQIDEILTVAKGHWESYIFCHLLWETGGRIAEIMLVRPNDIIWECDSLNLRTLRRSTEQYRTISVSRELLVDLKTFIDMRGIGFQEPILRFSTRTALNYFKTVCNAANIDTKEACPKKIRHSRAVYLVQQGYRIDNIAHHLGNRDIRRMIRCYYDPYKSNMEQRC